MLTLNLRKLERDGLLVRTVYPTVPPKVEYSLTPIARELSESFATLTARAERHRHAIAASRVTDTRPFGWRILASWRIAGTPVPHAKCESIRPARRLTVEATINLGSLALAGSLAPHRAAPRPARTGRPCT